MYSNGHLQLSCARSWVSAHMCQLEAEQCSCVDTSAQARKKETDTNGPQRLMTHGSQLIAKATESVL